MRLLLKTLAVLLPAMATADDARLSKIVREFELRELADDSVLAHRKWLRTQGGKLDAAFLGENFERLTGEQQMEIPTELARTGLLAAVPLVKKSLVASNMPLAGLFFATRMEKPEPGFNKQVATLVVPWIGKHRSDIATEDIAAQMLVWMDAELAARVLLNERLISINYPEVHFILAACNGGGLKVPRNLIEPLLAAWEAPVKEPECDYRIARGYREALKAFARQEPVKAIQKAEELFKTQPYWSEELAELPLLAAGLPDLYNRLSDFAETPSKLARLPVPAQFYFAVTYFRADCDNGGIDQALSNSTGDYLPLVRKAYKAIGDSRSTEWLDWMCRPFGKSGPSPRRAERRRQMDSMKPAFFEQSEQLQEQWEKRHELSAFRIATAWKLSAYVAKHAGAIRKALRLPEP